MTIEETVEYLREHDNYLIITHRRPDGDTAGCAGALADGLRGIGKTAYIYNNPETIRRYIPYVRDFYAPEDFYAHTPDSYAPSDFVPGEIITVDTASRELFPVNLTDENIPVSLCIDHHPSNTGYAQHSCIDGTLAACGELVYEILLKLCGRITPFAAGCLYTALSTDTGCFVFANTTANTLRVAASIIDAGAPHREINRVMFRTKTRGRVKIEGLIYSGIEFYHDGAVAIATITREMMAQSGCTEDDVDDIASLPGSIEGVLAGITIRELSSVRDCKVSVRTSPRVSANDLCVKFGGGGHPMAAGFSAADTVSEIRKNLLRALDEIFPLGTDES